MKSLFLSLGILSLFSFTSINISILDKQQVNFSTVECTYNQCKAIAKSTEKQCKHCVSNKGDSYCWQHD